jgi:SAM-dependent methyltransferase
MPLAFQKDERHPLVDTLLRTRIPRWQELDRTIDERDDMLHFATSGIFQYDFDESLLSYFQNGLEQYQIIEHIAGWRGGPVRRMLDFASGYGRLTRFLIHEKLADEITVSDILEGGMEFQQKQFGVRTIVSTALPENFIAPETYDLIFVASLFTHLPPSTFTPWLRRLVELIEPEGLLIFTVHDESIAPEEHAGDGIKFANFSESRVLDTEQYGSTWVTESYVREQLAAIDPKLACVRMPRALSDWQDVYVTSPSPIASVTLRRPPRGSFDECHIDADGIHLNGWATLFDELPDRVEVRIDDDVVASTNTFTPRPDVAAWLNRPEAELSGWRCTIPHAAVRSFRYQTCTVSAYSQDNIERVLFLGTIDSAGGATAKLLARNRDEQLRRRLGEIVALQERIAVLEHEKGTLQQTIDLMRESRFWKAREQWFRLKRAARLTDER